MEKRSLIFLITLIVIFAALWVVGLFFVKELDVIIFSLVVFVTVFIGQRYTLIKIKPASVRLMWSFLAADIFLYLCGINLLMAIVATLLVICIYRYAPKIGGILGLNDYKPQEDWDGTITDEGEVVGEYKYFENNRIWSFFVLFMIFYLLYFVMKYGLAE